MINAADITDDTRDITALWRQMTGEWVEAATAHLRDNTIVTVTVRDICRLVMCRTGACALITPEAIAKIEAEASSRAA